MTADFMTSFNKALSSEGSISNNKNDKGGFTYKGISRTKHPTWPGWKIIDSIFRSTDYQSVPPFNQSFNHTLIQSQLVQQLNNNPDLQNLVIDFYRTEFWNKIQGDLLPSQLIADELLESSINLGVSEASVNLQRTINLLNRNGKLYPDIAVDGVIGKETLSALNNCVSLNGQKLIYNILNFYQAKHYIEIMEKDRTQEIFIGWFNRIEIIK